MVSTQFVTRRTRLASRLLGLLLLGLLTLALAPQLAAHPMPNSLVQLDIQPTGVGVGLQIPLSELAVAFGPAAQDPATLVTRQGPQLRAYLLAHVRPVGPDGQPWAVAVRRLGTSAVAESASGPYQELTAELWLQPPLGVSSRAFTLYYDVVVHQLVTHKALVSIRQDWEAGVVASQPTEVGVIQLDVRDNVVRPLRISLSSGSLGRGFGSMVRLGMAHIAEGTDHLLFLLVLLLPAPLLARRGRWDRFGGVRYSLGHLLVIVSAFTVGHSFTLLLGALGWVRLPGQPVEILIAVSILVSAVHAWRPLFAGREAWVAGGFGLVHGLAFASTLANLHLDMYRLALSIIGFNLGIELMQLVVLLLTVPWLLLLSQSPLYATLRPVGAVLAVGAALAWLAERLLGQANWLTLRLAYPLTYAPWLLAGLIAMALTSWWWRYARQQITRL